MDVRIRISTRTHGGVSDFESRGELVTSADGAVVRYPLDGDEGSLELRRDRMTMRRGGAARMYAEFIMGTDTFLVLYHGDAKGEIPLHTEVLKVCFQGNSIFVRLRYALGSGADLQKFSLHISIQSISEVL